MDLTTVARVKALGVLTGSGDDVLLAAIVTSVSAQAEAYMRRSVQQVARTEVYPIKSHETHITLKASPVSLTDRLGASVTFTVKQSQTNSFTSAPTLTRNTDYVIEDVAGVLRMMSRVDPFRAGLAGRPIAPTYVQVTYTAGLAADTDSLIANYPDIAAAVDLQSLYWFQRKKSPGGSEKIGDSEKSYDDALNFLPDVRWTFNVYKRRAF